MYTFKEAQKLAEYYKIKLVGKPLSKKKQNPYLSSN